MTFPTLEWSSLGLVDRRMLGDDCLSEPPPLVRSTRETLQPTVRVIGPLDRVKKRDSSGVPGREAVTGEYVACARGEDALGRRIVEAIATTTQGTGEARFA